MIEPCCNKNDNCESATPLAPSNEDSPPMARSPVLVEKNPINHESLESTSLASTIQTQEKLPSTVIDTNPPFIATPLDAAILEPQSITATSQVLSQQLRISKLKLSLPNAKVNQLYEENITALDASGNPITIDDIEINTADGFRYEPRTAQIHGLPLLAGTVPLKIKWTGPGGHLFFCLVDLVVIADPKSLWNKIAPPANGPYFKKNTDSNFIFHYPVRIAAASRRGRSHEHSGSFRDDDFYIQTDTASGWSTIIVADGAGSAQFSRQGSKIAVNEFGAIILAATSGDKGNQLTNRLENWDESDDAKQSISAHFQKLFQEASVSVIKKIEAEAQSIPTSVKDYSTTLLVAVTNRVKTRTFIVAFWVGDGVIAAYGPSGKVRIMGQPDGGEHAGQTVFLDASVVMDGPNFFKRITMGFFSDITAVMLMTDGISDPKFETDNELSDPSKWDMLWSEISPLLCTTSPEVALLHWLEFYSAKHHDDRTIAVLW